MSFAKILKKIREQKGLSQSQLAKNSELTSSAISQFESNTRSPSSDAVIKIAKALGVTTDHLLGFKTKEMNDNDIDIEESDDLILYKKMKSLPKEKREAVENMIKLLSNDKD